MYRYPLNLRLKHSGTQVGLDYSVNLGCCLDTTESQELFGFKAEMPFQKNLKQTVDRRQIYSIQNRME